MQKYGVLVLFLAFVLVVIALPSAHAQNQGENDITLPFPTSGRHETTSGVEPIWPWPVLLANDPALLGCNLELNPFPIDLSGTSLIDRYFQSDITGVLFPSVQNPSVCYQEYIYDLSGDQSDSLKEQIRGQLMNYDPLYGPDTPTLPPVEANIVDGSSPLVPGGTDGAYEPLLAMAERSTAGGTLDLITGSPLLRSVDLELPFGGSVFRYVRTYAEPASFVNDLSSSDTAYTVLHSTPNSRLWDWHGTGWMLGHNPLFLFDSSRAGQTDLVDGTTFANRRCYFVPDAHHAIPFDMRIVDPGGEDDPYPVYEAPARFGAHMSYEGGIWDENMYATGVGGWEEIPELVYVWLNDGAVKYTIAVLYEDVPALPNKGGSSFPNGTANWPAEQTLYDTNQAFGVPFIGLTLQIEDRYGNRIVNEYCGFHQYNCSIHNTAGTDHDPEVDIAVGVGGTTTVKGRLSTEAEAWPDTRPGVGFYPDATTNNRTCCQSCHRKGQLQRTLLIAGDAEDSVPEWTIVYSHRSFASYDPTKSALGEDEARYPYSNQSAVSHVRVYRGDAASTTTCMTVDFRAFHPESPTSPSFVKGFLDVPSELPVGSEWTQLDGSYDPATDGVAKLDDLIDRLALVNDVVHPSFTGSGTLAEDWTHEVRYTYTDASDLFLMNQEVFPTSYSDPDAPQGYRENLKNVVQPRLIAVIQNERVARDSSNAGIARTTGAAYRYAQGLDVVAHKGIHEPAAICAVFEPDTVSTLFSAYQSASGVYTEIEDLVFALAVDDLDAPAPMADNSSASTGDLRLREVATKYFGMWGTDADEATAPGEELQYIPGVRRVIDSMDLPGTAMVRSYGNLGSRISYPSQDFYIESALKSDYFEEMVDQLAVASPTDRLVLLSGGPLVYADGRGGQQRTYKVYRFAHMPSSLHQYVPHGRHESGWECRIESASTSGSTGEKDTEFVLDRSALMFPHRIMQVGDFNETSYFASAPKMGASSNLNVPLWYAVIDEYPNLDSALVPMTTTDESGFEELDILDGPSDSSYRPSSRRIVALNGMGYVVWEETYEVTPDGIKLTGGEGHREVHVYDDLGRIMMTKSYGWHAAKLDTTRDETTEGLVTVYDYDYGLIDELEECPHPRRVGVQWGDNSGGGSEEIDPATQWLVEYARDPDRPEVVLAELRHDVPVTGGATLPADGLTSTQISSTTWKNTRNVVFHSIEFEEPTSTPGTPVFTKSITQKASAQAWDEFDDSGVKKLAVVAQGFDGEGRLLAYGRGLVSDLNDLGGSSGDVFYVDWIHYDNEGRALVEVQDAQDGGVYNSVYDSVTTTATINSTFDWAPSLPTGASHAGYVTSNRYGEFGLEDTTYPNGEVRQVEYKRVYEDLEVATFVGMTAPDSTPSDPTDDPYVLEHSTLSTHTEHGFTVSRIAMLVTPDGVPVHPSQAGLMEAVVTMEAEYDPSGRPRSQTFTNRDDESFEFKSTFNQYGTVDRVETALGTVTRQVYDEIGRLTRVYRGTDDWTVHFGAPPDPAQMGTDDMVLVETRRYGEGVHDAMQLTQIRTYREQPTDVYDPDLADVEDAGRLTIIAYDWRMRPVIRVECTDGVTPTPIRVAVTHLDQMGRERFEALYDADVLTNQDPTDADFVGDMLTALPTGGAFLYSGTAPIATDFYDTDLVSLSETTYSQRGAIESERTYDLEALANKYTETLTFYDHNGQPVYVEQPGEGIMEVSYDAFGREVQRSVFAGNDEVSRVETHYSPDGMPERIFSYDRLDGATGSTLSDTNAVISGTYHWYFGGDLVCTAELGVWTTASGAYGAGTPSWPAYASGGIPITYDTSTGEFSTTAFMPDGGSLADARVTAYVYDDRGNRSLIRHPDGTVTRHVYDDWGNIALTQEGITLDSSGALDEVGRATQYRYEEGKLVRVSALFAPLVGATDPTADLNPSFQSSAPAGSYQITEFVYGAEVVVWNSSTEEFDVVSANNDWVGSVKFPNEDGDPATDADLVFQYYPDGLLASRTDARNVVFSHLYDDLGRRVKTIVEYPDTTVPFDGGDVKPADRVELVEYEYDQASGVLTKATASSHDGTQMQIVAQSVFTYDDNQRLVTEAQQRGDAVTTGTPQIDYTWEVQHHDAGNQVRLTSMDYPERLDMGVASGRLTLDHVYGSSSDIDDVLGRVTKINAGVTTATHELATFAYTGSGMRVRRAVSDTNDVERAIEGFLAGDGTATDTYEHLDQFGRIGDLHWRDGSGVTQYRAEYAYDAIGNRIEASVTRRNSSQAAVVDTWSWDYGFDALQRLIDADADEDDGLGGRTSLATHAWKMDTLGNWAGDGMLPGLNVTDGAAGLRDDNITHEVGRFNRIESREVDDGTTPVTTDFVYDAMGNLVSDGVYWYRYDAWNRLIQVVEDPGSYTFDANGVMTQTTGPAFADVVAVFAYDSLGRLVGRQAPFPGTTDEWRTETYFYDGARRIAERWKDPILGNNGGGNTGNQQNQQTQYVTWTEREYVYTPGYIDEFVAEYDADGDHWPVLQDANFNAVALVDGSNGDVARQRVLSPYGRVLQDDSSFVAGSPATRIGHQGLFAERLDANTQQDPQAAGSFIAWHNRNRTVLSEYGRFAQRDPVGSGQAVSYAGNEIIIPTLSLAPEPILMVSGITNLYQYESSAPTELVDPSGLFGLLGGLGTGLDLADMSLDAMQQAYMGVSTGFGLGAMLQGYAFDQILDADWAGDWSLPDTMYAQSGYSSSSTQAWASGFSGPLFAMAGRRVYENHHIATPYGQQGRELRELLMGRGLSRAEANKLIQSNQNKLRMLGHNTRRGGGHAESYKNNVLAFVRSRMFDPRTGENAMGKVAAMKFKQAVEELKRDVKNVPDVLGKPGPGRKDKKTPWPIDGPRRR